MPSIPERVRRGAELLDRVRPGWWREIALDRMVMASCDFCILGQLYGHYFDAALAIHEVIRIDPHAWLFRGSEYGFTLTDQEQLWGGAAGEAPGWRELADAWRTEIRRRAEQPATMETAP